MKHMKLELLLCRFVDYSRQLLFTCTKPLFLFLGIVSPQRVSNTSNTIFQAYCHKLDLPPCRFVDYFQQLRLLSKYALISLFRDCFTTKAYLVEEGAISQAISHIFCPVVITRLFIATLVFQLEDTVRLFGTLLLLDTKYISRKVSRAL